MHDIKNIESNLEKFKENLSQRNFDLSIIDKTVELNKERKNLTTEVETAQSEVKSKSKEVGMLMKNGQKEDADKIKADVSKL
jgi:seryl-tRNA synthetase